MTLQEQEFDVERWASNLVDATVCGLVGIGATVGLTSQSYIDAFDTGAASLACVKEEWGDPGWLPTYTSLFTWTVRSVGFVRMVCNEEPHGLLGVDVLAYVSQMLDDSGRRALSVLLDGLGEDGSIELSDEWLDEFFAIDWEGSTVYIYPEVALVRVLVEVAVASVVVSCALTERSWSRALCVVKVDREVVG